MFAAGVAFAQRAPLFKDEILPILEKSCNSCHNPKQKMGGLDCPPSPASWPVARTVRHRAGQGESQFVGS
jgi:hypothetical protein